MTERLYDDGALAEFEAVVVECREADESFEIVLDRSAFFPEGGGQAGDVGSLGDTEVLDTFERGGEVIHKCSAALAPGLRVKGRVNWDIRLRRMQNHSGEHLLMGFIHREFGFDNVGFHLGSSEVTVDLNGAVSYDDLMRCEQLANEAIAKDLPITVSYPDSKELAGITYRSKLEMTENVRLVTIEGIDVCACCAPHLASTGRIGIIKILSSENYKGGTRLRILCGLDALELFRQRLENNARISRLLSAKPEKTADHVEKLLSDSLDLKRQLAEAEKQRTADIISRLSNPGRGSFCVFANGISADSMRKIANEAVLLTDRAAGVFCESDGGYNYIIISDSIPLRAKAAEINSALCGRGGGSDRMIQGTLQADKATIESFFSSRSAFFSSRYAPSSLWQSAESK